MPTIKEIAEKAGVSYSAVSRALNNKKGVNPTTRENIIKLASDMKYFPHSSAQALVQNKIGVLGIIIPRTGEFAFQNPFYTHVLVGLSEVANHFNYRLMLALDEHHSYASMFHRRLVDGVIVLANRLDDPFFLELIENNIPVVAIPGFDPESGVDVPSVNSENFASVSRGVQYLIDLGHQRISFIAGQMNSRYTTERVAAYKEVLLENGLKFNQDYLKESDFSKTDGFRLMEQLLNLPEVPTAVICINDLVTPGALHQIYQRGLRVPEDISVMAIGCSENYELYHPPLTVVKTRVKEVGRSAAQMLIAQIEKGECEQKHIVIESDLVLRESTGPPV